MSDQPYTTGQTSPSRRRLQRQPDFTGGTLTTFRDVFFRHGLPGAIIAVICLAHPGLRDLLLEATARAIQTPLAYALAATLVFISLNFYTSFRRRKWSLDVTAWALYLGALSVWEEWVFRIALPYGFEVAGAPLITGIVLSNLLFGMLHYFTLRWKWQWCVMAMLGGFAFSRQMDLHFDLLMVAGIHWVATYLNTPEAPGIRRVKG